MRVVIVGFIVGVAYIALGCGKEETRNPPIGQPGDSAVYDGPITNWDSNPEGAFPDAATSSPCSECVGLNCAADRTKYCIDKCEAVLECVDMCFDTCGAAPTSACKTPMGSFDGLGPCNTACYNAWPDSDQKTAMLAGCLAPTGACGSTCGR
jgi:hypothetical protein